MRLRKTFVSILGILLGLFVPASGADPTAPAGGNPADEWRARAVQLEEENTRLRSTFEAEVQQRAESLVLEVFPDVTMPTRGDEHTPHRPQQRTDEGFDQPANDSPHQSEGAPGPDRISTLEQQIYDMQVERSMEQLEGELNRLQVQYPQMDRYRILGQVARSGRGQVNLDFLARASHNESERAYQTRRQAELGVAATSARPAEPPPLPGGAMGAPASIARPTMSTATKNFVERAMSRGFFKQQ